MADDKRGSKRGGGGGRPGRESLDSRGSRFRTTEDRRLKTIVGSTTTPSFAVDARERIVAWNAGAERLLGLKPDRVMGRLCHEVVTGKDIFGNRFCGGSCPLQRMARRREAIGGFDLCLPTPCLRSLEVRMHIVVLNDPCRADFALVHLFEPVRRFRRISGVAVAGSGAGAFGSAGSEEPRLRRLTARESEILRLLATGTTTREIAGQLYISIKTVRNHVQHILRKLGAHSRLEAVSLAHKTSLL